MERIIETIKNHEAVFNQIQYYENIDPNKYTVNVPEKLNLDNKTQTKNVSFVKRNLYMDQKDVVELYALGNDISFEQSLFELFNSGIIDSDCNDETDYYLNMTTLPNYINEMESKETLTQSNKYMLLGLKNTAAVDICSCSIEDLEWEDKPDLIELHQRQPSIIKGCRQLRSELIIHAA